MVFNNMANFWLARICIVPPGLKSISTMILLLFVLLFCRKAVAATCTSGEFNLTSIQNWNTWVVKTDLDGKPSMFYMNLCDTVRATVSGNLCSSGQSSICLKKGEKYTSLGYHNDTITATANTDGSGFRLDYRADICPDSTQTPQEKWQTTIDFKCDKTLGSPVFIERSGCTYFFEWHSTVACKNLPPQAIHEVRCSFYDNSNKKRDLTPLIKQQGGYKVDSDSDSDLYINVCRDITAAGPTASCQPGSAGCLITTATNADGTVTTNAIDVGQPFQALQMISQDRLQLRYNATAKPNGCSSSPQVTIVFVCPREGGRNEGSQNPKLISAINCNYEVEWVTEFACEAEMLTTNTCAFTNDQHGIDLDLSPLTDVEQGHPYLIEGIEGSDYKYYLDVCQDMGIPCGSNDAKGAICQEQVVGSNRVVAGINDKHVLSYADGELTLTYKGGDVCNHNHFPRTSIISFECNKTAGQGSPTFVTETECTYFFEWQTQYACLDHPVGRSCHIDFGGQHYDLSPLVREVGSNWQALDGQHDHDALNEGEYFINICAEILPEGLHDHATCPDKSAACFIDHSNVAHSLGQYKESPVFQNGHITLTYYNGSTCGGKAKTIITFLCAYGDLESAPSFVRKSLDGCLYEFEWRTAAACPLGHKWGTGCRVFDDDAGFSFDLSRLTSATGYEISAGGYDYYINICAAISNTPCNDGGNLDAAACQVKTESTTADKWMLGRVNTSLEYFDGIVKLTYLNGDPYHPQGDTVPVKRRTEIAFMCAPDQDPGEPEYKYEAANAYVFNWYTKYACPEEPIECVVTNEDRHQQYDLSSLSKSLEEDNWSFVDDSDPQGNRKKYYINVCRPVNPVKGCGAFAGACQTEFNNNREVVSIRSMGVPKSKPVIESEGHLLLTYINGSDCNGGKGQVESRIHFSCRKGVLGSSPRLLEKVNDCLYSFIWETEAACAIDTANGEECTITDPNSLYVFNMQTLIKPAGSFYEITTPSGTQYQLNICGIVTGADSHCGQDGDKTPSACKINPDTSVDYLGFLPQSLQFSDDGLLKLIYHGTELPTGYFLTTEITFLCRHNVSLNGQKPTFLRQEDNTYIFNFETPLACLPESVDCLVSDDRGNQYDLSPLAKDLGNWKAVDTRPGMNISYYINVCRPINSISLATQFCPGGPIGACQTTKDNKAFNMGYVQAMPEAAVDGSLSIRYVNGDLCHGKYHRSTRINFECSTTPGSPVFQLETESCEYIFTWETPAACPVKRVEGADCRVQVPNYEFEYDLSSLHNTKADYIVRAPPYEYRINVCGALVAGKDECGGEHGVGACQEKIDDKDFTKNAGKFNQKLKYDDGTLKLNYTSGEQNCHSKAYNRSTAINFFCDEGVQGTGQPTFINEDSDCTYIFEWATPLACPPFKVVECSYSDNQQQFDLAPLARVDDNYRIDPMATVGNDVYYINVCRSLLHKNGSQGLLCPRNAAACLNQGDKYFSLGEISKGPTMENGHLVLRYESGDPCPSGAKANRTSIISLECDKEGVGSTPQYSYSSDNCEYHFIWLTNLACIINEETEIVTDDCTAVNPATGFKFDLNTLQSSRGYTVHSDNGDQYVFSLCAPLNNSQCQGPDIGSCQVVNPTTNPRTFNSGKFNGKLHYHDGTLFLNYEGGAPCHNNAFTRSTIINFVCSLEEGAIGEPVFVDESEDCTYYISWHTSLVCEKFIQCNVVNVVNGSRVIDLSPLVSDRGYYLANSLSDENAESQYYINLCQPLNPIPGVRCPPGSAACLDQGNTQLSLGVVDEGPKVDSRGHVSITYTKGGVCPEDKTRNITTVIMLFCERGTSQGTPTMDAYSDCTYRFSWLTNAVCPPSKPSSGTDCKYFNDVLQYEYDLSSLATEDIQVSGPDLRMYKLHLCNLVSSEDPSCQSSAVCLQDGADSYSLGTLESQQFLYEGHILKLHYIEGSQCDGSAKKKMQTTIFFKCSETIVPNQPTFFSSDNDCHHVFKWETPLACPPMSMPCDLAYMQKEYDLQPLSQITGSWHFLDDDGNKYFMNLCQPAFNTPEGCPKEASICRQRPDGKVDTLGMVYTQLLNADGDTSEPNIHVTFREGSPKSCSNGNSASAESEIIFTCSDLMGLPSLKSVSTANDADCKFTFVWESKVACSEERVAVELTDGKVTDPETKSTFDLSPLIKHGTWEAEGDERNEKTGQQAVYTYLINLGKTTSPVDGDTGGTCNTAAVCQSKKDDPFFRSIGEISAEKFFMKDEILEMVITKPSSCGKEDTEDVETTIIFKCDPNANLGNPIFNFESINCRYYFMWETSTLCSKVAPTEGMPPDGGHHGGGGTGGPVGGGASKIPVVVGVLLGIVVLCVLIIVFHKSERRSAFYYRVRGYFPGAYNKVPAYSYSQLSNGDVEETLLGQSNARSIYSDDEDEELLKDNSRGNPIEYRDDSDEEILPTV